MLKFGTKIALFGHFWALILRKLLSYLKLAPSNLSNCKFLRKTKGLNLGPKPPYFGNFDDKCLIFVILGINLKKYSNI